MADSAFTYYLGGEHRFDAVTLVTRGAEPTDVLTFYYDDPNLLTSPSCAAALGSGTATEIVSSSSEHAANLHRVDDPLKLHAHIKKTRSEIVTTIAVLFSRHMSAFDVSHHVRQFNSAWQQLLVTSDVEGLLFVGDPQSYVNNRACTDLDQSHAIDRSNFDSIR